MIRRLRKFLFWALLWAGIAAPAATALPPLEPLSPPASGERILILAPHEDDETLGAGGLIQQAVTAGASVRVVYLTYGDHNELAFLLYRKRPWLTPRIREQMGQLRRDEATEAMAYLGVAEKDLVFLGYPDGATLEIWKRHWGRMPPMVSRATRKTAVPYDNALSYGHSHRGEEILKDLQQQLLEFHPTRIFVTQPVDAQPDHRAYFLFLEAALRGLVGRIPPAQVFTYPIHLGPWPVPTGAHPQEPMPFPKRLADDETPWWSLELTPEQARRKLAAIGIYKTQTVNNRSWMQGFARRNELFNSVPDIPLRKEEWSSVQGLVARSETEEYEKEGDSQTHVTGVSYRDAGEALQVRIALRRPLDRDLGVSILAFGFRRDRPFGAMPKLRVVWRLERLHLSDRGFAVRKSGATAEGTPKSVLVTLPWRLLGEPETVFIQAQGQVNRLSVSQTSWRVLLRHE